MTFSSTNDLPRLGWVQRLVLISVGGTLLSLLATAAWLQPDPDGLGTHQQLGLPPCTFRVLFETRCPACGMTTSWAHVVRGQWLQACRANLGGTLLALTALVVGPWSVVSAIRGRWLGSPPRDWALLGVTCVIVLVTLLDWAGRWIVAQWS